MGAVDIILEERRDNIVYYVCNECNLYHAGKKMPVECDRCKSPSLEKVIVKDKDFNYVMKIAMGIGKK